MKKYKWGILSISILCVVSVIVWLVVVPSKKDVEATIYQLTMTDEDGGAGYGIVLPSGKLIMIDGGYTSDSMEVAKFIEKQGGIVSAWFITHPHFDHVGGLLPIMEGSVGDFVIETVYYSEFTEEYFTTEAEGKDLEILNTAVLLEEFHALFTVEDTVFTPVNRDDVIELEGITITCMNGFDELVYDVNANSLVLHFDFGVTTFLATGDITDLSIMNMIAHYGEDHKLWDVDYVQIPHHGYMAGISNDQLYRLTTPAYAFLDCSLQEFVNDAVNIQMHLEMLHALQIPIIMRFEGDNEIRIGEIL
ncbi:MAG: MBL fold metallo-hydrolase [Eubacteriales bacterium]